MYTNYRGYLFNTYTACWSYKPPVPTKANAVCRSGWDTGLGGNLDATLSQNIVALLANITNNDLRVKAERLLIAVEQSISYDDLLPGSVTDANTLRIFVAPEFYFRSSNKSTWNREYSSPEFYSLITVLREFFSNYSNYHGGRKLKNWLFLCGTCVYRIVQGRDANQMPVYGFNSNGNLTSRLIRKMYTSNIDGISPFFDYNNVINPVFTPFDTKMHFLEEFSVFVEICLEHRLSVMVNAKNNDRTMKIRCHVISAAGMDIIHGNTIGNTLVFRNDGMLNNVNTDQMRVADSSAGGLREYTGQCIYTFNNGWVDANNVSLNVPFNNVIAGNVFNPKVYLY